MAPFLFPLLLLPLFSPFALSITDCPFYGPDVPAPRSPSKSKDVIETSDLVSNLILRGLVNTTIFGPLSNTTSFSVQFFSLHEDQSIFSFDYTSPTLQNSTEGVKKVGQDTIYRIGSVSKLLTVYVFLAAAGDSSWSDPISKYIPELADYSSNSSIASVNWDHVTVGALASHLGGVGRDARTSPTIESTFTQLGLPSIPSSNISYCGLPPFELPCDRAGGYSTFLKPYFNPSAFLEAFASRPPTFAPFRTPSYSNTAYTLLGYALENITGQSLASLFSTALTSPLNLTSTTYSLPASDARSVIPSDPLSSLYNVSQLERTPGAGYYSSARDLTLLARSILNSTLLPPALTHRWLLPTSPTANPNTSIGAPWEIYRLPTFDPYSNIQLYTKNGVIGSYSTEIALLPDLDAGFVVLAAGSPSSAPATVSTLSNMLATTLGRAIHRAAREYAKAAYEGVYTSPDPSRNSSLEITVDVKRPGLGLKAWTTNGTDGFDVVRALSGVRPGGPEVEIRLYPIGLVDSVDGGVQEAWRAVWDIPEAREANAQLGPFSEGCPWGSVDLWTAGGVGLDEFVFRKGEDGKVEAILPLALGEVLDKEK